MEPIENTWWWGIVRITCQTTHRDVITDTCRRGRQRWREHEADADYWESLGFPIFPAEYRERARQLRLLFGEGRYDDFAPQ